jgi:hypothetical protein
MTRKIPLVVVEQHQHVLEHVHLILRKDKRLLQEPWTMVHFDAHPDMACSTDLPAKLCFVPRGHEITLYDHLDQTSTGIAEWILPLVVAANLQHIVWVKPPFSRQFSLGEAAFRVGVHSKDHIDSFIDLQDQVLRVDYHHPYYLDDDVVVEPNELQLAQPLHLQIKHVGETIINLTTPWMLDLCLDYFVCCNPFLRDLEEIDKEYATLVASISDDGLRIAKNRHDYRAERSSFHKAMEAILLKNDQGEQLYHYFDKDDSWGEALRQILKKADNSDHLIQMTLEALPHMDMPHEHKLPSFPEIQKRIQEVMAELQQYKSRPPFLVTIARSTNDGFCPASLVEQIEEDLLQRLHEHYCGCNGKICCTLRVVKDYGNWEGSTFED